MLGQTQATYLGTLAIQERLTKRNGTIRKFDVFFGLHGVKEPRKKNEHLHTS